MNKKIIMCVVAMLVMNNLCAQQAARGAFKVIPLGIKGGLDEGNLSAYMIAPAGSANFICADAGTIRHGIDLAIGNKVFKGSADEVLKNNIKGYLISHPHLDHVAGLIMNSPEDSPKNIYAFPSVIDVLKNKYFTWKAWANFTNEGELPHLNKYSYVNIEAQTKQALSGTEMEVTAFSLSHGPDYQSTAFLIGHEDDYLLYLGDTGADEIEKSNYLHQLWQAIAPLVKLGKLKAIFIETSFANKQPDKLLFGHLTPRLLMQEMNDLSKMTNAAALQQVSIVITHMKAFGKEEKELVRELQQTNSLQLKLVFPIQGKTLNF
jgi:cAMP phosphodiesterase